MRCKFIDKILSISNKSIEGIKCISLNEDVFEDHFHLLPVFPAAMMVETAMELVRYYLFFQSNYKYTALLKDIKSFRFYTLVAPGACLTICNRFLYEQNVFSRKEEISVETLAKIEGEKIFEGKFSVLTFDFKDLHHLEKMRGHFNVLYKNDSKNECISE